MAKKIRTTPVKDPATDALSTANACAERLKRCRNFADTASLEDFTETHKHFGISYGSWKNWESGHYPLSAKGAEKACAAFKECGLRVSIEYLLHGTPPYPRLITQFDEDNSGFNQFLSLSEYQQQQDVFNELMLFRQQHPDAIDIIVPDNSMLPAYALGDHVAGIKCTGRDITKAIGKICIIETEGGELAIRKVLEKNKDNTFSLICLNQEAETPFPKMSQHTKLAGVAPILWKRIPVL